MTVMVRRYVPTHFEIGTTEDVDMEIFPSDTDVLMFDTGPFVRVVGRRKIFTKVEHFFRVRNALLEVLRCSTVNRGASAGTGRTAVLFIDEGALT